VNPSNLSQQTKEKIYENSSLRAEKSRGHSKLPRGSRHSWVRGGQKGFVRRRWHEERWPYWAQRKNEADPEGRGVRDRNRKVAATQAPEGAGGVNAVTEEDRANEKKSSSVKCAGSVKGDSRR